MADRYKAYREIIDKQPMCDTHEHIVEESQRLQPDERRDFTVLVDPYYAQDDLLVSGLDIKGRDLLLRTDVDSKDKWKIIAEPWNRCRHTGYMHGVRESLRILCGEDDLHEGNVQAVSDRIASMIKPGYYRYILKDICNIDHCQVNSANHDTPIFRDYCEMPDLLCQDLNLLYLSTTLNVDTISKQANKNVTSLADWHEVIDWAFAKYGPRAIAAKTKTAYTRSLDFTDVPTEAAALPFHISRDPFPEGKGLRRPSSFDFHDQKLIEDHLFHYCVKKCIDYDLPIKFHTGYYMSRKSLNLRRIRDNIVDLCDLFQTYPSGKFVLLHVNYPYMDDVIAAAKHHHNVWADMAWTWVVNPHASVRFVKDFIKCSPINKLLIFGADYNQVELVPGEAAMARHGLALALSELVEEGWLVDKEVPDIIERVMYRNARELYDYEGTLKNWDGFGGSPSATSVRVLE